MARHTPAERQKIIKEYKASGMTQRAFAERRGITTQQLQYWLYSGPSRSKTQFVEVKAITATGAAAVRLRVASEVELSLVELPPPAYLADLVRSLQAP